MDNEKFNNLYKFSFGVLIFLFWKSYIHPFIQMFIVEVSNKNKLNAVRINTQIQAHLEQHDGFYEYQDIDDGDDYIEN